MQHKTRKIFNVCRYSGDGKYYPCMIKSKTEHGAIVTFEGYGNEESVCIEHMKVTFYILPKSLQIAVVFLTLRDTD